MRLNRQPRLVSVTFHRMGGNHPIQTRHIRHHLECLSRCFEMSAPSRGAVSGSRENVAMVTIDDCHRDIYQYIYPVALSLKVPITICVPTDFFLRNQWLWFDQLYWLLERATPGKVVDIDNQRLRVGDAESVAALKKYLKALLPRERTAFLSTLTARLGLELPPAPVDGYEPVAKDEMREMLASGLVEISAHTVTHTIATVLPDADFRQELAQSKQELESFCGHEIPSFCYPNGETGDFDERTTRAVKEAGFKMAFTSVKGTNVLAKLNPYLIRRVHAHSTVELFEKDISGLGEIQRRLQSPRYANAFVYLSSPIIETAQYL
jgi:peptidoglycan/xylan/chitin deacetylase (PgdA/CDA1 family)